MAISEALRTKLNEQITNEIIASQTYLSMACTFDGLALKNLAARFRKQTDEERTHALKILDYILAQAGKVRLQALPEPPAEFPSVVAAIDAAVEHEQKVTRQINALMTLAEKEQDYATQSFLKWFVDEQVEEVETMQHLAQVARMAGNNLLQLEAYLAFAGKS